MSPSSKRPGRQNPPRRERREPPPPPASPPAGADPDPTPDAASTTTSGGYGPLGPPTGRHGRLAAFFGLAYALVGFVGWSLLPVGGVRPTDPAPDIARELADQRGQISAGILLTLFSLFFFIVFLSWLHRWLRDAEGEGGWVATVALVGGVLLVAMLSLVTLLAIAASVLDDYGADPVIARTLLVLQWQAVAVAFVPSAAFIGGTAFVGHTTGVLPRWLNYSGMIIALGLLLPPIAFLPFLLSSLWTGMVAVMLLQRSRFRL
ncbi:MAG TPA: DUF4386 family protein [Acidimicrobiales bacterium]|nr:DUF4386 family protein [Acidimicrobiales bacterium]